MVLLTCKMQLIYEMRLNIVSEKKLHQVHGEQNKIFYLKGTVTGCESQSEWKAVDHIREYRS